MISLPSMDLFDIFLTFIYFVTILVIGLLVRSRNMSDPMVAKYFMKGLFAKLFGGIAFALVYTYYYTYGGDTKSYFHDSSLLVGEFIQSPLTYFKILFADSDTLMNDHYLLVSRLRYDIGTSEWFTVKFTSIATFFGMDNYFSTTLVFAGLSYIGIWKFFKVLIRRYPDASRSLAFSLLFMPSVFFWGSGIMKDCIVIGLLGLVIHLTDQLIIGNPLKKALAVVFLLVCSYLIFNVKSYVIISLIPAIIIWVVMSVRDSIENKVVKFMVLPILVVGSVIFVVIALQFMGQYSEKYNVDTVFKTAEDMQNWHYLDGADDAQIRGRGSSYTLGEYEPTMMGTLSMFFPAVNVTYFRPYLWEVENVAMLAASIESTIIFLYTVFIFMGLGFFRVIKLLNADSFLLMSLTFALFFGFAIGFSTYNFGALARYKIPCMPFYLSSLFVLQYKVRMLKDQKKLKWKDRKKVAMSSPV